MTFRCWLTATRYENLQTEGIYGKRYNLRPGRGWEGFSGTNPRGSPGMGAGDGEFEARGVGVGKQGVPELTPGAHPQQVKRQVRLIVRNLPLLLLKGGGAEGI
jgi:hypothetical protein